MIKRNDKLNAAFDESIRSSPPKNPNESSFASERVIQHVRPLQSAVIRKTVR